MANLKLMRNRGSTPLPVRSHSLQDLHCPRHPMAKKPTREERERMCTRKRRYVTQADALNAAAIVGRERDRKAYRCPICGKWHLTSS